MPSDHDKPDQAIESPIARQSMREFLDAHREILLREEENRARETRRRAQDERLEGLRKGREARARQTHARRVKALSDAQGRVGEHVGRASRNLRAALREIAEVDAPRHTAEGREQQRIVRSLQAALGALRRVGRGHFQETDIDLGAEVEVL